MISQKVLRAINDAAIFHDGLTRKGKKGLPYVSHLYGVMTIIHNFTHDEDILIASLLHDTVEDVKGVTPELLRERYGNRVAELVEYVTEPLDPNKGPGEQLPWEVRKEAYLKNVRAGGKDAALISLSDKLHNILSTEESFANGDMTLTEKVKEHLGSQKVFYEKVLALGEEVLGNEHELVTLYRDHMRRILHLLLP